MFFWNLMNELNMEKDNKDKNKSLPFFMPLMLPWPMLESFLDKDSSSSLNPQEFAKNLVQQLISIDATPKELEKLQDTMDQLYEIYSNNKLKQKKKKEK